MDLNIFCLINQKPFHITASKDFLSSTFESVKSNAEMMLKEEYPDSEIEIVLCIIKFGKLDFAANLENYVDFQFKYFENRDFPELTGLIQEARQEKSLIGKMEFYKEVGRQKEIIFENALKQYGFWNVIQSNYKELKKAKAKIREAVNLIDGMRSENLIKSFENERWQSRAS